MILDQLKTQFDYLNFFNNQIEAQRIYYYKLLNMDKKQEIDILSMVKTQPESQAVFKNLFYYDEELQIPIQVFLFPQKILIHNNKIHAQIQFDTYVKFSIITRNSSQNNSLLLNYPNRIFGIKFQIQNHQLSHQIYSNDQTQLIYLKNKLSKIINQKGFSSLYKATKKIAKGSNSTIYYARRIQDDKEAAIKAFSKQDIISKINGWQLLLNEIKIMRQLNHQNIINLYQVLETQNSIYVSAQYLSGGELYQIVNKTLTYKQLKIIIIQLLKALQYLAQKQIIHRDIKPQNILFKKPHSLDLVLADFALSTTVNDPNQIFLRCGTPGFVAPEILKSIYNNNQKPISDMFSLGCTLHIVIFNQVLFQGDEYNQILQKNRLCQIDFQQQKYKIIDGKLLNLLKQMLQIDPNKRITPRNALNHQFFNSNQNDNLQILLDSRLKKPCYQSNSKKQKYIKVLDSFGVFTIGKSKLRKNSYENQQNKSQTQSKSSFTSDSLKFNQNILRTKESRFTYIETGKNSFAKTRSDKKRKASQIVCRKLNFFDECSSQ